MLHLHVSNSLTHLAKKLSEDLQQQHVSVFQPYYIVTQTDGMNNWLKLQIAQHNGIAANCIFLKPNDFIYRVYQMLGGRFPNTLSQGNLTWLVYSVLGEKDFNDRHRSIADYYATDTPDKDIKRLALAEKITDLFDQYQIYRPEMINEWNKQAIEETGKNEWQQFLWKKAKELSGNKLPDKTVLRDYIINTLKDAKNTVGLQDKIPAVYLFGLSVTTSYHLNIFNILSESIDIHYYLQNPAPSAFWFEDKSEKQLAVLSQKGWIDKVAGSSGNVLLTNWGRVISDTYSLLFQNEELLNVYEETEVTEPFTDTLLHKIQNDIFKNAVKDERNLITFNNITDGSLTINACYTIAREVEVVYNYLVHLVDKRKEHLSPRDIVVMVTDIDSYAPYIKAVFSNAPYKFKYTIADESFSVGDSMINALKTLLAMSSQSFKAEEVLQLLDSGFIRKRFGLSNLQLIRKVVDKANIRFGMEGRKEDETLYVSWSYGIERIVYGICMSGDEEYNTCDEILYPLDIAEGGDALELIRFTHFVKVLMESINERHFDRTIAQWVQYVEKVIQNMVRETEEEAEEEYNLILSELEKLNGVNEFFQEKISFDIFSHQFVQSISSSTRTSSFASGGITFCSLIPMRSIPFKVVALLGLNFDKFPRREISNGFNLMDKKRMKGDRNVKDNDKHLFLETILSSQKYLYMSYIGQSAKDNTTVPPSALLDELIDYIETRCDQPDLVRTTLVKRHPLHSFSRKYNHTDPDLYDYLNTKTGLPKQDKNEIKATKSFGFEEVSLDQFVSFFKHPFKEYYNKILSIYYENEDVLLSDTEIFKLDNLQKWSLKQDLLHLKYEELATLKNRLVKTGELPLKNMADIAIAEVEKDVSKVRELYEECVGEAVEDTLPIDLNIDNTRLKGLLSKVFEHKLVYLSYSKHEYKQMLDAYIHYLAAKASGFDIALHFISAERHAIFVAENMTQAHALEKLEALLALYKQGFNRLMIFHPLFKIEPHKVNALDSEQFRKIVHGLFNNFSFPCDDQYLLNEYKNGSFNNDEVVLQFKSNCELLVEPLADLFPGYFK